jgi:hypothetical protein
LERCETSFNERLVERFETIWAGPFATRRLRSTNSAYAQDILIVGGAHRPRMRCESFRREGLPVSGELDLRTMEALSVRY